MNKGLVVAFASLLGFASSCGSDSDCYSPSNPPTGRPGARGCACTPETNPNVCSAPLVCIDGEWQVMVDGTCWPGDGGVQTVDAGTRDAVDVSADACTLVANRTFMATQMMACGLLVPGQSSGCYWTLAFTENGAERRVTWHHLDMVETLTYQCDGPTISAFRQGLSAPVYSGVYDFTTGAIDWDGIDYVASATHAGSGR